MKRINGIIILNKPAGITSFGAVAAVRRITHEKKCGHTGTLDPMATGVMTVMLGAATRFCELLPVHDKAYRAKILLGTVTDTLDITGKVLEQRPVTCSREDFERALKGFTGEISQLPPMYSAVSVGGKRLYDLARQGIEVERKERRVTVYSAGVIGCNSEETEYDIEISCSAGTYIRTLADDIGRVLGCGAVLSALCRTEANGFSVADALTVEQLEEASQAGSLASLVRSVDGALASYPSLCVTEPQAARFKNGGSLDRARLRGATGEGIFRIYSPEKAFLGLGELAENELKIKRVYMG